MGHDPQPRVGQASDQAITVNDRVDVADQRSADRSRQRHPHGAKRFTSHTPRSRRRQPCRDQPQASRNDTYRRFRSRNRAVSRVRWGYPRLRHSATDRNESTDLSCAPRCRPTPGEQQDHDQHFLGRDHLVHRGTSGGDRWAHVARREVVLNIDLPGARCETALVRLDEEMSVMCLFGWLWWRLGTTVKFTDCSKPHQTADGHLGGRWETRPVNTWTWAR